MANVLLIEDDDIMLRAIQSFLNKGGYKVIVAKNGKEAFEKIEEGGFDVVISDLMMPYANGLEIISKLRTDDSKSDVGIIIVSSVGNEESVLEAFRLGADDYLKKPIMAGELLIRVQKLLADKARKAGK